MTILIEYFSQIPDRENKATPPLCDITINTSGMMPVMAARTDNPASTVIVLTTDLANTVLFCSHFLKYNNNKTIIQYGTLTLF